jgi:hypothetical protein
VEPALLAAVALLVGLELPLLPPHAASATAMTMADSPSQPTRVVFIECPLVRCPTGILGGLT